MAASKERAFSFGSGVKFVPLEGIAHELDVSEDAAQAFIEMLGLTVVHPPGGRRMVNLVLYLMALWSASRIGAPHFVPVPDDPYVHEYRNPTRHCLPPQELEDNFELVAAEIAKSKKLFASLKEKDVWQEIRDVTTTIFLSRLRVRPCHAIAQYACDALVDFQKPERVPTIGPEAYFDD